MESTEDYLSFHWISLGVESLGGELGKGSLEIPLIT